MHYCLATNKNGDKRPITGKARSIVVIIPWIVMVVSLLRIRKLIHFHHVGKLNVIHVVYVATRSLFAQFIIYNLLFCINMINMCCVICTCIYIYLYVHIWQHYYLDYFTTLKRILSMCLHANELLSSLFAAVWMTYIICTCIQLDELHIYIYIYWNLFAHRKYMFMCVQSTWIRMVVSYVINDIIIHHFRSSLFSFRIAIFWEDVPFPVIFVNFLMHGTAIFQEPCPVSNEWTMRCLGCLFACFPIWIWRRGISYTSLFTNYYPSWIWKGQISRVFNFFLFVKKNEELLRS